MSQPWEPCPRCRGGRVVVNSSRGTMIGGGVLALFLGVAFVLLFWPLALVFGAAGLIMLIAGPFAGTTMLCRDCRHSWAYNNKRPAA